MSQALRRGRRKREEVSPDVVLLMQTYARHL
jgi:hypothetical protein